MRRLRVEKILPIGLILFLIVSCASSSNLNPGQAPNLTKVGAVYQSAPESVFPDEILTRDLSYFLEISLGSEYGVGSFTVKKWRTDIRIEVLGQPTLADMLALKSVINELNELLHPGIQLTIVPDHGNLQIHFIPHSQFYQFEPPGIIFYGGFFHSWWNYAGEIYRSRVVIGSDRVDQTHRTHLIREELTQALGLMNDSMKYKDSIFYQGTSHVVEFSPLDQRMIRWLYSDVIQPGMTQYQIRKVFHNPVLWEKSIVKTYP